MSRSDRMFEIIQLLRSAAAPLTAETIAVALEVTKRTVYRDISALAAMRVPIEGEAGIGYVMRPGFDLPPLMFSVEEIEAIAVGLALLGRAGDAGLLAAAASVSQKIGTALPGREGHNLDAQPLYASRWHNIPAAAVDLRALRQAIRNEERLRISYQDAGGNPTKRTVKPLALVYYVDSQILVAWCELRADFRHFRLDKIAACKPTGKRFTGQGEVLRMRWQKTRESETVD